MTFKVEDCKTKVEVILSSGHFRISLVNDPHNTQYHSLYGTTYQAHRDSWRSSYLTIDVNRAKEIKELMEEYLSIMEEKK